jgi:hypothetical protein
MSNEKRVLNLLPPNDPRVRSAIAPFNNDMLKEHNFSVNLRK